MYQSLDSDKPKVFLLGPTSVAAMNIGAKKILPALHTACQVKLSHWMT